MWGRTRPAPFGHVQRVRPQDCAASGYLGHPRLLEFFEAAFIECWRALLGPMNSSLGRSRLTVAEVAVQYHAAVAPDDEMRVEVSLDRIGATSIRVHYDASVAGSPVAEGTSRYVHLDATTGRPTPLPAHVADQLRKAASPTNSESK